MTCFRRKETEDKESKYNRLCVQAKMNKDWEALIVAQKKLTKIRDHPAEISRIAEAYIQLEQPKEAEVNYMLAISSYSTRGDMFKCADIYERIAKIWSGIDDDKCIEAYETCLTLAVGHSRDRINLEFADQLISVEKYHEAAQAILEVCQNRVDSVMRSDANRQLLKYAICQTLAEPCESGESVLWDFCCDLSCSFEGSPEEKIVKALSDPDELSRACREYDRIVHLTPILVSLFLKIKNSLEHPDLR